MPNASPCYFSAGDVKVETYYHGHQSVLIARDRRYMCNKAFYTDLSPWPMTLTVNPSELRSWSIHTQLIKDKFASCNNLLNTFIYRVGEKSKLLILSEYVNKTEKIGVMWTNTNSYRESEDLSAISMWNIFTSQVFLCLNILLPIIRFDYTTRPLRKHDVIEVCSVEHSTAEIELVLPTFKSCTVQKLL